MGALTTVELTTGERNSCAAPAPSAEQARFTLRRIRHTACISFERRGDRSGLNGRRPTTERPAIFVFRQDDSLIRAPRFPPAHMDDSNGQILQSDLPSEPL